MQKALSRHQQGSKRNPALRADPGRKTHGSSRSSCAARVCSRMPKGCTKRRSCATSTVADRSRSIHAISDTAVVNVCRRTCKQLAMTGMRFARDPNCKGRSHELVNIGGAVLPIGIDPLDDRTLRYHALVLGRALAAGPGRRAIGMSRVLGFLAWARARARWIAPSGHESPARGHSCCRHAVDIRHARCRSRFDMGFRPNASH